MQFVIKLCGDTTCFNSIQSAKHLSVCVEVLWPSQPDGVMLSLVSLP